MITTFCPRCGSENPFENQFCGKCGIPLLQPKPAEPVAVSQVAHNGSHDAPPRPFSALEPDGDNDQSLHGPSFLGLSDEPDLGSYLLDDEHPGSHWGVYIILLLLAAGAFLAWRQMRAGGFQRSHLAAIVQDVRSKVTQEKQEAASVAPNANPAAAENASAANSPAPTPTSATSASPASSGGSGAIAVTAAPTASEMQTAAQKQKVPAPPAALAQTAALAKPPAPVAKPRRPPAEPIDNTRSQDAQNAALLASAQKYLYGQGVPQSCDRALSYLREAVEGGSVKAKSTLGGLYATGHCVPLDRAVSYHWFALALRQEPNNSYLSHDLEMLWNQMSPQEKRLAINMTR